VLRDNGDVLGTTPLTLEEEGGAGALELRLEKEGWKPTKVILRRERDADQTVKLVAAPATKKPRPRPPHGGSAPIPGNEEPAKL
jgi:hypothetical protein